MSPSTASNVGWWIGGAIIVSLGAIQLSSQRQPNALVPEVNVVDVNAMEATDGMSADVMTSADAAMGAMGNETQVTSSMTSPRQMTSLNYEDIESSARLFVRIQRRSGMLGAREYSEKCHEKLRSDPTWAGADRCAAFDFAAAWLDQGMQKVADIPRNGYFAFQADNQADSYAGLGSYIVPPIDRLRRIKEAVGSVTGEEIDAVIAKERVKRDRARLDAEFEAADGMSNAM